MVRHIILWKIKSEFSEEQKAEVKRSVKAGLEGLLGQIPGLTAVQVRTEGLETSTADMMLDTTFETFEAYQGYKKHPAHLAVANSAVRPNVETRLCMDYEE